MGKWAMYKRRGSTGTAAGVTIESVTAAGATEFIWQFDAVIATNPVDLTEFTIDATAPLLIFAGGAGANFIEFTYPMAAASGLPWTVSAVPAGLTFAGRTLTVPQEGTTD